MKPDASTAPLKSSAEWYDANYYRDVQLSPGPWHKALLPDLATECGAEKKFVELGCGQAQVPRLLAMSGQLRPENIYGMDQSSEAIRYAGSQLPGAHFSVQDLYQLDYPENFFDLCIMLETIEHLERPEVVLQKIFKIIKPGGVFYLSFPNYLHLPWLLVRLLAPVFNKPNWIGLQPVDKIYTVVGMRKLARQAGFRHLKSIGSNYGPPVLYPLEKRWLTDLLNRCGMYWWSLHPVLKFTKPPAP